MQLKPELTQQIIQRFTVQSFAIKGFAVTFVGFISNAIKDNSNIILLLVACVTILVFWYLDSFYLSMERIYRKIEDIYTDDKGLNYKKYNLKPALFKVAFSKTIFPLYFTQILFIFVLHLTATSVI
ncbi:hypothetical protein N7603_00700 [Acholeplasma vituli]|uniref:DUF3899 domain-containing protein n=1 Tax=Paracholeplasma vituli TaxID=69473 RepID=A0ABT2PTM1_9MOLU|nr:hypothetical protein [Paracholeplasma vituli]MCU0104180.1 hypothetical protein [Paracholeplasma vituli]